MKICGIKSTFGTKQHHMTMYGWIFFPGVVVTTQNPENEGKQRVQKTDLLFLIVQKTMKLEQKERQRLSSKKVLEITILVRDAISDMHPLCIFKKE